MNQVILVALSLLISTSSFAQSNFGTPASFKKLNVNLPKGCPIVERPADDEPGPYLRTYTCNAEEFKNTTSIVGKVYRVVDGDTIHFFYNNKVYATRMLGMDTAELHYRSNAQPVWGLEGRNSLRRMVTPGDMIRVEFDQVKCDRYGRMLVHIFKGNVHLNLEQVKRGVAANYCIAPNMKYCKEIADAYRRAEAQGLAMHADRCAVTPYIWRRAMENTPLDKKVKDARTGIVYAPNQYYKIPVADRVFIP